MREMGGNMGTNWKKGLFSKSASEFRNFLWVVGHFISVISCILDLTNFSRETLVRA